MATIDHGKLEVHVIGADEGESIVLGLPNDEWGVVDCCAGDLSDENTNPTLRYLRNRGIGRLAFVCMTHPHVDHYRGISQLLTAFNPECFWFPSAMTGSELELILRHELFDAKKSGSLGKTENARELLKIFGLVKDQKIRSGKPKIPKRAGTGTSLYPTRADENAILRISALAPSTRQAIRYESKLKNCFDADHRLKSSLELSDHNWISMALLVTFGETRVVLAGDVEENGWNDVLEEIEGASLSCHAVKISHHGSKTGYCDNLWSKFARERLPISILTPFKRHRLPRQEAIQHIRPFVDRISCACLSALDEREFPIPFSTSAPVASRAILHQKLGLQAKPKYATGRCTFVFDDKGNCTHEEFDGDAGDIPSL